MGSEMCIRDSDQGVSALCTILESIPVALDSYRDDEELDLAQVVNSLPIFADLATLAETGRYTEVELRDIDDTMHQGIMLALESGVVCHHMPPPVDPENRVSTLNKRAPSSQQDDVAPRGFASEAHARYGAGSDCLLYTSPSPRDATLSRMPSSA